MAAPILASAGEEGDECSVSNEVERWCEEGERWCDGVRWCSLRVATAWLLRSAERCPALKLIEGLLCLVKLNSALN